jgi:hypothetical protein
VWPQAGDLGRRVGGVERAQLGAVASEQHVVQRKQKTEQAWEKSEKRVCDPISNRWRAGRFLGQRTWPS